MEILRLYCLGNEYYVVSAHHPLPTLVKGVGQSVSRGVRGVVVLWSQGQGRHRVDLYNPQGVRVVPSACALRCAGYALGFGSWQLDTDTGSHWVDVRGGETVLSFPSPLYCGEYQIGRDYHGYLVNLVQRYFVSLRHDIDDLDIEMEGEALDRYFGGVSTVFVQEEGRDILLRIWRRGGELSGSCTGACAVAAVLHRLGKGKGSILISMPGGQVIIERDCRGGYVQTVAVLEMGDSCIPNP